MNSTFTQNMQNFRLGNPLERLDRNRPRRVVFYGRVSTEHEAQLSALENQMQWYDDQGKRHPNWNVLDKYIDEGITGTQAKKRPAFLKMIEDAQAGRFDLIVTREVCRFARNTVDTLNYTRELRNIGIEVYFVEDNIWTMDGDGELRLTIMATLAQEESRKVSERVKAGQQISRLNGTVYGCGNILGYERVGDTYVINNEQAETVRMIFDMYMNREMGAQKIAQELVRLGRKTATGTDKWNITSITRVLNNRTYTGYMAYGKSFSNNYLEQRRINNHDQSTYMLVKCDFPAIISEEDFERCQAIKESRIIPSLKKAIGNNKKNRAHGTIPNHDLWCNLLRCSCGARFRKNRWHQNKNQPWSYGYQCYNQLNNGTAKKRREAGADDTGYCDMNMIADWKLKLMCQALFDRLWHDRKEAAERACELIKESYCVEASDTVSRQSSIVGELGRLQKKKERLTELYTDGEISKNEYSEQKRKIDKTADTLNEQLQRVRQEDGEERIAPEPAWDEIRAALAVMTDFSQPDLNADFIRKNVSRVETVSKTQFRWYMNLDGTGDTMFDCVIEGNKKHPVVIIDDDDPGGGRLRRDRKGKILDSGTKSVYNTGCESGEILLSELDDDLSSKRYSLLPTLHRQQ